MDGHRTERREAILQDALRVFGRFGYRKTSVQDIATAAGLSKPGLYLHFAGKDEIFAAAMQKYLGDALERVQGLLDGDAPLQDRLVAAMETWFGRHLETFTPEAFDLIGEGDRQFPVEVEGVKDGFRAALAASFRSAGWSDTEAKDRAEVMFLCGLSWKQPGMTAERLRKGFEACVRVCCQGTRA
jgi:AcrR family transcriptional regulator